MESLKLKSYEIPEDPNAAKAYCKELVGDIEKTHQYYQQQIEFIKQQYKIALRHIRPTFVTPELLREIFDESEMTTDPKVETTIEGEDEGKKGKKKRAKKKKAIPDHFPRTIVVHDVDDEKKQCEKDGSELSPMGFDVKLELKYTRAKFEVLEHRYPKYTCRTCKEGVFRKEPAPSLIPQSYASPELLAHIAVSKFCDHLPLYRQQGIYARDGLNLTRQVMADWMIKLGNATNPLIGIKREKILDGPAVAADETPLRLLTKDGVRTSTQAYMWQLSRWGPHPLIVFEFDATRKKEVAERLLGTYSGYVQIDGYSGYNILFGEGSGRIRVGCMAHVLRKFKDLLKSLNREQRFQHSARQAIRLIDKLYKIEDVCRGFEPDARRQYRINQGAEALLEELQEFVGRERLEVSKSSPYHGALKYAEDELPHIKRYLEHGAIELDNNNAENAIRPFALGRRNWLFMCTEEGAQASANIFSLLITAKANGIEPYKYLLNIIRKLPYCSTVEDYEALLPV